MAKLKVEFESPDSGAYIHEMTDKLEVSFGGYKLVAQDSESVVDIWLTYPDGNLLLLESILGVD